MLKFLHLADLHLGAGFDLFSAAQAEKARSMQMDALAHAIRVAHREKVQAILIAGDLFETPFPPAPIFAQAMHLLGQADCPVYIAPGNHDYIHAGSPYLTNALPANVRVFTASALEASPLCTDVTIWGAAFHGQSAHIPLDGCRMDTAINLCLVHTDLQTDGGYNHYTPAELSASGFSYLAAGHNHTASGLRRAGGTVFGCPGSLAAVAADETGPRGFLLIEISDTIKAQFIASKALEFQNIEIDLSPIPSDTGLQKVLIDRIPQHHERVAAKVTLTGERVYEPNLAALRRVLDQVFFSCTVLDRTTLKKPLWRYLQQDDLRGAVSRKYRDLIEASADPAEKEQLLFALRCALAAFDGDTPPVA